ncbi:MAG: Holliday junction branch migration protein RuvA, partial [Alphaproteobacteria bacterium]|nr:Holliday junction branch migration protein RuvA [Alphaproteobacteria bacterium]
YGFLDVAERDWFRLLQTVQGVGAKVALALLSALSTDELARAIIGQDKTAISRAQGVGPKLATRLLHELKDKAGSLAKFVTLSPGEAAPAATAAEAGPVADAVSALENLGYRRPEAIEAVAKARRALGENAGASDLIRGALREIAS